MQVRLLQVGHLMACSLELRLDERDERPAGPQQGDDSWHDGEQGDEGQVQGDAVHGLLPRQVLQGDVAQVGLLHQCDTRVCANLL